MFLFLDPYLMQLPFEIIIFFLLYVLGTNKFSVIFVYKLYVLI